MARMPHTNVAEMIVTNEQEIVGNLTSESISTYEYLQKACKNTNVSTDRNFRDTFVSFYKMRFPKQEYRNAFFRVFEEQKGCNCPPFESIAKELFAIEEKHQFSFITKMLHTISDERPIYDSQIDTALNVNRRPTWFANRLLQDQEILNYLKDIYAQIENENLIESTILAFDKKFIGNSLSFTKKIDFFLWARGKQNK